MNKRLMIKRDRMSQIDMVNKKWGRDRIGSMSKFWFWNSFRALNGLQIKILRRGSISSFRLKKILLVRTNPNYLNMEGWHYTQEEFDRIMYGIVKRNYRKKKYH